MKPDDPQLCGQEFEQPRVVKAIGCQRENGTFALACFIRNHDRDKRLAVTMDEKALFRCARKMDDNLAAHGISWDGSYRIGTPRDIWEDADEEKKLDVQRLIIEN